MNMEITREVIGGRKEKIMNWKLKRVDNQTNEKSKWMVLVVNVKMFSLLIKL